MLKPRALVAMSGGVDSSVAAALLVEQGYEVLGVTMSLICYGSDTPSRPCCSADSIREAGAVADESVKSPEFVIRAPVATWRRVIEKKLDPIQGMITGQLKLKGTMGKIMRYPKAASELVNCATKVPTEFPG